MNHAGYIDGEFVIGTGQTLSVEDPSTGRDFASLPGVSPAQVEAAILAARKAFERGDWSGLPAVERAAALNRFLDALARREAEISDVVATEAGCPTHTPIMWVQVKAPIKMCRDAIDLYLGLPEVEDIPLPISERVNPMGQVMQALRHYTPIGVVSAIAAYNFPFYTALWKVIPALVAGNTMVLRPSPLTPLSAMAMAEAAKDVGLPPGVLNVVLEPGIEGGHLMTTHPEVDMVAFTGSTNVGAMVMAQAAPTFKRLQLELGGKSAQIFLPDAVDRVAAAVVGVCTAHAGQACTIGSRIFVPEENKAEVLEKAAAALRALKVGPTRDPQTQVGPVISAAQVEKCEKFVRLATENGGKCVAGGARPSHLNEGYYFEPTLLDLPDNKNPAAQEEIFGPVVGVIGYRDLDHAVEMANDSRYGLYGYVHGNDRAKALQVGLRLKTGALSVNGSVMSSHISIGGQRASGIGRERGVEGQRLYQQLVTLTMAG